jgi:hypothetical protein
MRQQRLHFHRTFEYVVTRGLLKFGRIMPPQQTRSYGHAQQGSQQQQTAGAWSCLCDNIASNLIVRSIT